MSRYLNEGAVWSAVKRIPHITMQTRQAILEALRKVPSADVVEVVRCKDCFFYQKDKELAKANYLDPEKYCALLICEIDKNGFCSYGKKNGR